MPGYYTAPMGHLVTGFLDLKHIDLGKGSIQIDYTQLSPSIKSISFGARTGESRNDVLSPFAVKLLGSLLKELAANNFYFCFFKFTSSGPSLTEIVYAAHFNNPVDELPSSLRSITFGKYFKQTVDHLPPSLQELIFHPSSDFNHSIDKLPTSLQKLVLGYNFNQPLDRLPPNLRHFELLEGRQYNHFITSLPASLIHLKVARYPRLAKNAIAFSYPPSLVSLTIQHGVWLVPIKQYPASLQELTIDGAAVWQQIDFSTLPSTCKVHAKALDLRTHVPQNIKHQVKSASVWYPLSADVAQQYTSLTSLSITTESLIEAFPPSLVELSIINFNIPFPPLPLTLKILKFGNLFDQNIDHLPSALRVLHLGNNFNQPVDHLPNSLRELVIDHSNLKFAQNLDKLPLSLGRLALPVMAEIYQQTLPPALQPVLLIGQRIIENTK